MKVSIQDFENSDLGFVEAVIMFIYSGCCCCCLGFEATAYFHAQTITHTVFGK